MTSVRHESTDKLQHSQQQPATVRSALRDPRRLKTEVIDLYLLHWRGSVPLAETAAAMRALQAAGKIRHWGVSNLDVSDLEELGGDLPDCATDQVLYNLQARGIEYDLLPFCRQRGMPVMAYSPVGQGGALLRDATLGRVAACNNFQDARAFLVGDVATAPGEEAPPLGQRGRQLCRDPRQRRQGGDRRGGARRQGADAQPLDRRLAPHRP